MSCQMDEVKRSEEPLILQLAREIPHTVDADEFCFTALRHIAYLLEAERCSLFWIRDSAKGDGSKELASRLLNVDSKSKFDDVVCDAKNAMVLPIETGISGFAARTKSAVKANQVYQNPEFNRTVDEKTGFVSRDLLCHPLVVEQTVVGTIEVVNKKSRQSFTEEDEEIVERFILLCNLAITNSRGRAHLRRLEQAAQLQEDLSRKVSELWSELSYDDILKGALFEVSKLVDCQRYTLFLSLMDNCKKDDCLHLDRSYDIILRKTCPGPASDDDEYYDKVVEVTKLKKKDWVFDHKIVQNAIARKKTIMISKITPFSEYKLQDDTKGFSLKSALCTPLLDGNDSRLLGILFLANKKGAFGYDDEATIEAVRPYLNNCLLFANSFHSITVDRAKTRVAEEMLQFHMRPDHVEVERLSSSSIPDGERFDLYNLHFSDINLTPDETMLAAMRIFQDIDAFNLYKIPKKTMVRWLVTTRQSYRQVAYHNWRHGFHVAHTMTIIMNVLKKDTLTPGLRTTLTDREFFALIVACFSHDIDHRGTNNAFLIRSGSPLALLYNTSTLENHHYDTFLRVLQVDGCNIFANFSSHQFQQSSELIKQAILATDLTMHFKKRSKCKSLLERRPDERDFADPDNKLLLISLLMTCCDLSSVTKPWKFQEQMARMVTSEFYDQGDVEREMFGSEPIPMMNRKNADDLPKMQIGFIDGVCSSVYQMMADLCPAFTPMRDTMMENRERWTQHTEEQEGNQVVTPKEEKEESQEYENLWVKYWNMDPENFIWGIDPNEVPPEVVIERVIFSPKKNRPSSMSHNSKMTSPEGSKHKKRRNRNKVAAEDGSLHHNHHFELKATNKSCVVM